MTAPFRLSIWGFGLWFCGACLATGLVRAADPAIDSVMYQDPPLSVAADQTRLAPGIVNLWLEALGRPEIELRYRAASALGEAHRLGLKGPEKSVPRLMNMLNQSGQDAAVQVAVAQALIDLDARAAAPSLWKQAQAGSEQLRRVVEPALAHWRYRPAGTVWVERLGRPDASGQDLLLAIRGLAALREVGAVPSLRALVMAHERPPAVRLEAARALGTIQTSGLEGDAKQLFADAAGGLTERLEAVLLLEHHKGATAVHFLQNALRDPEPAVVQAALTRLRQLDPKAALPTLDALLANRDASVRAGAVEVLFHEITEKRLSLLARRCADPHPDIRRQARRHLHALAARPAFHPVILKLATELLGAADWRGQEQAAILLGQLDDKSAATRLVELLPSYRPEVCLAAAWALRKLAVRSTLPAVLAYVRDPHRDVVPAVGTPPAREAVMDVFDAQMSQLVQLLGQSRYAPADPVLRSFIPRLQPGTPRGNTSRPPVGPETRAAAVWALGLIHEGRPEPELVRDLEHRLLTLLKPLQGGDDMRVARMFAVSLARMKAPSSTAALRKFYEESPPAPSQVRSATAWGLHQLTGKSFPPDPPLQHLVGGWFLSPIEHAEPISP